MKKSLVSHGASEQECWGVYYSATEIGYGSGYANSCIHSGSNEYSGGDTVWYNYTLASAGTIIDENTTEQNLATNITTATESVCPKGWTLPTTKQINTNLDVANFLPVKGGTYVNGTIFYDDIRAYWLGSEAYNGGTRYRSYYSEDNKLKANSYGGRAPGMYIRCVSEEKTVLDLTYMQDMTRVVLQKQ